MKSLMQLAEDWEKMRKPIIVRKGRHKGYGRKEW